MNTCKKLRDMPLVVADWQHVVWCPDCEHYDDGMSTHSSCAESGSCPLGGDPVPLRRVEAEPQERGVKSRPMVVEATKQSSEPRCAVLEQALRDAIVRHTGSRARIHDVEVTASHVTIRGCVPCYHVKQLAISAVLLVVGFRYPIEIELEVLP
jgi:hypothetical protein